MGAKINKVKTSVSKGYNTVVDNERTIQAVLDGIKAVIEIAGKLKTKK